MKQIRTIKYIDMFVPTKDHTLDYLIDITRDPYYSRVSDINQNIFNVCQIIFKKSLDYGFPKSKAIHFCKNAGLSHLEDLLITDQETINSIISNSIERIIENHKNNKYEVQKISSDSSSDTEFIIVQNDSKFIVLHDYSLTGIDFLKHLVDLDSKMIIYKIDIELKKIFISFLDLKNVKINITDFLLSSENIDFIKNNIANKKQIITVEDGEFIKIYFLERLIYDTKDNKINFNRSNEEIISDESSTEEEFDESDNILDNFDNTNVFINENKITVDDESSESISELVARKKMLINPILFGRTIIRNSKIPKKKEINKPKKTKKKDNSRKVIINPWLIIR